MHYDGLTYRPPYEANSILLQVSVGCSHNACTFCTMYRDVDYRPSPIEEVEQDVREAARLFPFSRRVFLVNGDPFTLPAQRLLQVADLIHEHLPQVETIGCYASICNIAKKTDDELAALARAGYSDVNVGLESGLDDVLSFMNKGYDLATAKAQLARLKTAGLPFNLNVIVAAAGPARAHEHALACAEVVNLAQPTLLFVSPLHVDPGSDLEGLVRDGAFEESTLGQYILEETELLENLDLADCTFFGLHVSNPVPVLGHLPQDKASLLYKLRSGFERIPAVVRDSHPYKGAEGRLRI